MADAASSSGWLIVGAVALVAIAANAAVLVSLACNSHIRSQANLLLGNLAAADCLMATGYACYAARGLLGARGTQTSCAWLLAPIVWATLAGICALVPVAHYRVKLVKAYSRSVGSNDISEPWMFRVSIAMLWIGSFVGAVVAPVAFRRSSSAQLCLVQTAFNEDYLIMYFLFTTTVSIMVATDYIWLFISVAYGSLLTGASNDKGKDKWNRCVKFDPRVSRVVFVMAGTFISCWAPQHSATLYLLFSNRPFVASLHLRLVAILPLIHSTLNPFIYSLSEREFREFLCSWLNGRLPTRLAAAVSRTPRPSISDIDRARALSVSRLRRRSSRRAEQPASSSCAAVANTVPMAQLPATSAPPNAGAHPASVGVDNYAFQCEETLL